MRGGDMYMGKEYKNGLKDQQSSSHKTFVPSIDL